MKFGMNSTTTHLRNPYLTNNLQVYNNEQTGTISILHGMKFQKDLLPH